MTRASEDAELSPGQSHDPESPGRIHDPESPGRSDDPKNPALDPASSSRIHDPETLERLDRALLRMRRTIVRPEIVHVPIPALNRTVDLAKVMGCLAVSDLCGLGDHPAVTVKDVAAALDLDHSTASRLLVDMDGDGLVVRGSDPSDRRRTVVELTETGEAVVRESASIRTWAIDLMLSEWSEDDLATFTRLVEQFSATIETKMEVVLQAAIDRVSQTGT